MSDSNESSISALAYTDAELSDCEMPDDKIEESNETDDEPIVASELVSIACITYSCYCGSVWLLCHMH